MRVCAHLQEGPIDNEDIGDEEEYHGVVGTPVRPHGGQRIGEEGLPRGDAKEGHKRHVKEPKLRGGVLPEEDYPGDRVCGRSESESDGQSHSRRRSSEPRNTLCPVMVVYVRNCVSERLTYGNDDKHDHEGVELRHDGGREGGEDVLERLHAAKQPKHAEGADKT
jgi:hypothetical protein